ncbi:MAG: hypothetical protein IJ130_14390 [Solobacterium sp.]|nr:hypothetical protein [Solobacterium sp.]
MNRNDMSVIAGRLKELIDKEGPEYLSEYPDQVYRYLVRETDTDDIFCAAVLYTLHAGVNESAKRINDRKKLSSVISDTCSLKKKLADDIAELYVLLYSSDNLQNWNEQNLAGLNEFTGSEQKFEWDGYYVWDAGSVTMDCRYHAEISAEAVQPLKCSLLAEKLKKNPFLSVDKIHDLFQKDLKEHLENAFDEYCGCDDYYPPVTEDFEMEYYAQEWCRENGFEMIQADGDGITGDFEPKSYRTW